MIGSIPCPHKWQSLIRNSILLHHHFALRTLFPNSDLLIILLGVLVYPFGSANVSVQVVFIYRVLLATIKMPVNVPAVVTKVCLAT